MNRVVVASVVSLFVIALLASGVYFYQRYSIILENPIKAVPADAAFIIEAKHPAASLKEFFSGDFKKSFSSNPWFSSAESSFHFLDSVLSDESDVEEIWKSQPLVISAHLTRANNYDFLFLTNIPRGWSEKNMSKFIEKAAGMENPFNKREYENVNIYEGKFNDSVSFTFASVRSITMFSFTSLLVEQAIRQMKNGEDITKTTLFKKNIPIKASSGEVNVYLNYPSLHEFASSITSDNQNLFYTLAGSFARWSGLNAENKGDYFEMHGNTSVFDSTELISLLRNQQPQSLRASSIAPARTAMLFQIGLSNSSEYFGHLYHQNLFSVDGRQEALTEMKKKYNLDPETYFTSWVGNEIALIITEPPGSFIDNNIYACVHANNEADALNQLNDLRKATGKKSSESKPEEKYRNHLIDYLPLKEIVPLVFGKIFNRINNCYYTSVNNFIVFANQPSALKDLIDENEDGKVFAKDLVYNSAKKNLSALCNVSFYLNPQRAANMYGKTAVRSFRTLLAQANGIHAQWINEKGKVPTEVLFDFSRRPVKEPSLLWSSALDTIIATNPILVSDKGQPFFFVQDAKNNLYKIDGFGNIVWKKEWFENIISDFSIVDFYHDGQSQLLFNTAHQLCLIDLNGEDVGNYPIRLPASATNGCTVTDIYGNGSNTIFIACQNHLIYAYQQSGKPVSDWSYYHTIGTVTQPIKVFTVDRNKYFIVSEDSDAFSVIDRRGVAQVAFKNKFVRALNSSICFVPKDSVEENHFITTDSVGMVLNLSFDLKGEIKYLNFFKTWSALHAFAFADIEGSGNRNQVFLDGNELTVFHPDGSTLFTSHFTDSIAPKIYTYSFTGTEETIFVTSQTANKIYMLNKDGSVKQGFPLKGCLNPVVTSVKIGNDYRNLLIAGSKDNNLQVYELK